MGEALKSNKKRPFYKKKRYWILGVFAITLFFSYRFLELRQSDATFLSELGNNVLDYEPEVGYVRSGNRKMRYFSIGNKNLPTLVFVHGAPSSSSFWTPFLQDSQLLSVARLVAIDRPGYGYSNFGKTLTSIEQQAKLLHKVIEELGLDSVFLHGSSYGGTLVARYAMDYPDKVGGALLQSASLEPGAETIYDITYPTNVWPLNEMIPTTFKVANEEKLSHQSELEKMKVRWKNIKSKLYILHGEADDLIFVSNAHFAKQMAINAKGVFIQTIKNRGHDLMWTETQLLKSVIQKMIAEK